MSRMFILFMVMGSFVFSGLTGCTGGKNEERGNEGGTGEKGFLFGAATSGFQVDMGCPTLSSEVCDDPHSDGYQFVTSPEMIRRPSTFLSGQDPARVGPGHWELYENDFDLAAGERGLNGFRMSIEWSRIFPEPTTGIEGLEALRAVANQAASPRGPSPGCIPRSHGKGPSRNISETFIPSNGNRIRSL